MERIELTTIITSVRYDELEVSDRNLIDKAKEAVKRSYAPYSHFHVGAALLLGNGEVVCGANQENAAFPSGTCAERTALFYAGAQYPGTAIVALAIAAESGGQYQQQPISPCGACRQALLEYEKLYGNIRLLLYGSQRCYIVESVHDLMPLSFTDF